MSPRLRKGQRLGSRALKTWRPRRLPAPWARFEPLSGSLTGSKARVFALFFWCTLAVFDLAACYIDNELGGLAEIAGTLWMLGHHLGKPY
jgi:hypothetical protein